MRRFMMEKARGTALIAVALLAGLLVTPAGAHVSNSFGHLWNKHILPQLATPGTINDPSNPVDWTRLKGVPAHFADGNDETGTSAALSSHRSAGPSGAPTGPAFTTVVTRQVPKGFYVFLAKTTIITSKSTGSDCILTYDTGGGEKEADRSNQSPLNSSVTARTTHNLQRLLQFGQGAATVRLKCRAGTTWTASDSGIIAMRVDHASDSEVNG